MAYVLEDGREAAFGQAATTALPAAGRRIDAITGFGPGSADLPRSAATKIALISRILLAGNAGGVRLLGYADGRGTAAQQNDLGLRRARSVQRALAAALNAASASAAARFRITLETAAPSANARGIVEVYALPVSAAPPPVAKPLPKSDTLERLVRRGIELVPQAARFGVPLSKHQQFRISCWLPMLLRPDTDDRFIMNQSALDFKNSGGREMSFSRARQWLLPEQHVRQGYIAGDRQLLQMLLRIDEAISDGREYINDEYAQRGVAVDIRLQQVRSWMANRERDPRSIYNCYYRDAKS
jgi:hypothetical protein